jgi:hypothetical protein
MKRQEQALHARLRNRDHQRKRLTTTVYSLLALVWVVAIWFLFRQQQLTKLPPDSTHQRNATRLVHVYSLARTDRTGAVIHDRLLAHALVYHWNRAAEELRLDSMTSFVYSGACLRHVPLSPRLSTERLLRHFGWDTLVPYRCPTKQQSAVYIPDAIYKCVGERELLTPRNKVYRSAMANSGEWQ